MSKMQDEINILSNFMTEHIEDNYYYGEVFGLKLVIDSTNGFFNATKLCESAGTGKTFSIWRELRTSKALIEFILKKLPHGFVATYPYKIHKYTKTSGIYVCNELLFNIASWAFPEKYLKFNNILISEAERENFFGPEADYEIINNKFNRILFQLGYRTNGGTINNNLDKILFQLEKQQKPLNKKNY